MAMNSKAPRYDGLGGDGQKLADDIEKLFLSHQCISRFMFFRVLSHLVGKYR